MVACGLATYNEEVLEAREDLKMGRKRGGNWNALGHGVMRNLERIVVVTEDRNVYKPFVKGRLDAVVAPVGTLGSKGSIESAKVVKRFWREIRGRNAVVPDVVVEAGRLVDKMVLEMMEEKARRVMRAHGYSSKRGDTSDTDSITFSTDDDFEPRY